MASSGDRLPSIWDFAKHVSLGWRPGLSWYPYKTYKQRLRVWKVISSASDVDIGPLVASRLEGEPFEAAIKLRIIRGGEEHIGEKALLLNCS